LRRFSSGLASVNQSSELPKGWTTRPFFEVVDFKGGSQPPKSTFSTTPGAGRVRLLQSRDFASDEKAVYIKDSDRWPKCTNKDIMVGRYGASVGKILTGKAGAYNVALVRIIVDETKLLEPFIYRWLHTSNFQDKIHSISRSAQDGFNKADFEDLQVTVPPLPEQRRIVAKLDSLTGHTARAREELGRIPRLVQKYRAAILAAAFSGELTKHLTSAAKQSWSSSRIDTIASVGTGATPKRGTRRYYEGGTIPWVTSAAANQPFIDNADEIITEAALDKTNCKVFPAGTLLLAMYGEGQTRGRVATLRIPAATNQALAAIQVKPDGLVLRDFLMWFLRAQYFQLREKAAGGVQPNLNLVKSFLLPVPPQHEQAEIIRHIETAFAWLDRVAAEYANASRLLPKLDQAIQGLSWRIGGSRPKARDFGVKPSEPLASATLQRAVKPTLRLSTASSRS
jgi:type I restriction enzyme, S subunit